MSRTRLSFVLPSHSMNSLFSGILKNISSFSSVAACLDLNKTVFGLQKIFCFHTAAKIKIISLFDETREETRTCVRHTTLKTSGWKVTTQSK